MSRTPSHTHTRYRTRSVARATTASPVAVLIVVVLVFSAGCTRPSSAAEDSPPSEETLAGPDLAALGLETDASIRSIELDAIQSGGPGKDDIPALTGPEYAPASESLEDDDVDGIFVEIEGDRRFYPYNIMVWHEIVNDTVGGQPVAVTF